MQRKPACAGAAFQVQARADKARIARRQHWRVESEQGPLRGRRRVFVAVIRSRGACAQRVVRSESRAAAQVDVPLSSSSKSYSWSKLKALACCTTSGRALAAAAPVLLEKKTTSAIAVTCPMVMWNRAFEGTALLKKRIFSTAATCNHGRRQPTAAPRRQLGTHGAGQHRHAPGLCHEAALHDAGVELRDADANSITAARFRDGTAKHLHRLYLLHHALRRQLHSLPDCNLALQYRAGKNRALTAYRKAVVHREQQRHCGVVIAAWLYAAQNGVHQRLHALSRQPCARYGTRRQRRGVRG